MSPSNDLSQAFLHVTSLGAESLSGDKSGTRAKSANDTRLKPLTVKIPVPGSRPKTATPLGMMHRPPSPTRTPTAPARKVDAIDTKEMIQKLKISTSMKSLNDTIDLPISRSDVLPAHHSKIASYPTGAQFSGFYSKIRQEVTKTHHIPTVPLATLIQQHTTRQASVSPKTPVSKPIIAELTPLPQTTHISTYSTNSNAPLLQEIDDVPQDSPLASQALSNDPDLVDPEPSMEESINSALVKLTDADVDILSIADFLRTINLFVNANDRALHHLHMQNGLDVLLPILRQYKEEPEIQALSVSLLSMMYKDIPEAQEAIKKKDALIDIMNAAIVFTRHIVDEPYLTVKDEPTPETVPLKPVEAPVRRHSQVAKSVPSATTRRASGLAPKPRNSSFSAITAARKQSVIEEESNEMLAPPKRGTIRMFKVDSDSLVDGLLSEFYEPDFLTRYEESSKKKRQSILITLLSLFEKLDKLLAATSCTSLDVDIGNSMRKIIADTGEILQAELVLLYELDPETGDLIYCDFEDDSYLGTEMSFKSRKTFPQGTGIAGMAATSGELVNLTDPINVPKFNPEVDVAGNDITAKHILSAPLSVQDGPIIAVLQVVNRFASDGTYELFSESDAYLLKLVAKTLAIVMTNAKSIDRMQQTNKKVKVLLDTTKFLSSTLDFDVLTRMIMESAKELLSADRCTLFLKDEARKQLVAKIVVKDSIQEIRIRMDAGIAGSVLMSGKSVNIRDAYKDSRFNPEVDKQTGYVTKTILCMPITNMNGEVIGVTQMINKKNGIFTVDDEQLLSSFSAQTAVAIEKTQLFKKTEDMRLYQQSIFSSITSCVITLNESMRMVSMNQPWFMNAIGTTTEAMTDTPVNKWIGPENQHFLKDILQVFKSGKPIFASEYELKGVKSTFVNYQIMPLITGSSTLSNGVVMVLDDISSEKKAVMTLGRYMSPELAKQVLLEDGGQLGGTRKKVTILFSDIRSFTKISEAMEPHEVVELLNQHFTGAVNAIIEEHGILDKFIGDAIMAVFGVPFAAAEDPINSCNAALRMQEAVRTLNDTREAAGLIGIKVGIGINTGPVLSGNIGSPKRMEFSCIGDAVNLASRVEGITKSYGVTILVTEFTLVETGDIFLAREVDSVIVTGKTQPVKMYELIGRRSDVFPDSVMKKIKLYAEGLALYKKRRFEEASERFQKAITLYQDGPSKTMLERCVKYIENPPDKNWNGVHTAEGK